MKRLLIALVILTGFIGSTGAVWASDLKKGNVASEAGNYAEAAKWFHTSSETNGRSSSLSR